MTEKRIRIVLDSKGAKRNADELNDSVKGVGFSVNKLAAAISGLIAGGALANFLQESIAASIKFEKALSSLSAITGATGDDLNFLRQSSIELAKDSTLSAAQVAEAFKLVASAKPDLLENAAALRQVTKEVIALSEAGEIELTQAANAVGQALNQFGEGADQAARFVNVLAAGAKFGASEIFETADAIKNSGVAAAAAGVSFEQANAAIQVLAGSGIKAAEAGTSLRNILTILDTSTNQKLRPSVVGLSQALENLNKENLSAVELVDIFGRENINAGRILSQNAKLLDELTVSITGTNTAYEQQAIITDNLDGDIKRLNNSYDILKITVGDLFNESLRSSVQTFAGAIDSAVKNFPQIIDAVELLAVVLGARLGIAVAAVTVSFVAAQAQSIAYQAALARMAGISTTAAAAQTALALAARGATAAMTLLGGPLGVIAIAATALIYFSQKSNEAADAAGILATETKSLTEAQKELLKLNINQAFDEQITIIEDASNKIKFLNDTLTRGTVKSKEGIKAANDELVVQKARLDEARIAAEKLTEKLAQVIKPAPKVKDAETVTETAVVKAKGFDAEGDLQAALDKENANLRVIESAKNVTKSLEQELSLRRQVSDIYRSAELGADASMYEQQLAMINARAAEESVIAQARAGEEMASRSERLSQLLANDQLENTTRDQLRAQYDNQEKIARQLLNEELNSIDERAANERIRIAEIERQSKIQLWGDMASSGIALMQAFGSKSQKSQKLFARASIIADTAQGIAKGVSLGWPAAVPAIAFAVAGGKRAMDALNSSSMPSGGGSSLSSAPAATSAPSTSAPTQSSFVIRLEGLDAIPDDAILSGRFVKQIGEKLEQLSADGVRI